jgi:hypothetical protein
VVYVIPTKIAQKPEMGDMFHTDKDKLGDLSVWYTSSSEFISGYV